MAAKSDGRMQGGRGLRWISEVEKEGENYLLNAVDSRSTQSQVTMF